MLLFETTCDLAAAADVIRRRHYGVIETANGEFERILWRPFPKVATAWGTHLVGRWEHRLRRGNRCRLYFNQPRSCPNFLALRYVVTTRDADYATFRAALEVLDEIARLKSRPTLCYATPPTSDSAIGLWPDWVGNRTRRCRDTGISSSGGPRRVRSDAMSGTAEDAEPLVELEPESPWERAARWFGPLILLLCTALAYANSFHTPFIFDGVNYLRDNPEIRVLGDEDGLRWDDVKQLVSHVKSRPLGYLTFALNYAALPFTKPSDGNYAENEVWSWHLTNLLIHVAGACALFGIARRTFASRRLVERYGAAASRLGLAIALVWAVHPLCTQSVTYLYQRLESLMGMFYLFTLYAFVRYAEAGRIGWAVVSLLSCLAACATKEVAVTAPLMVLIYDRVFLAEDWRELFRRRGLFHFALWLTLLFPLWLIYLMREEYPNAGILDTSRVTPDAYLRTQPGVVLHYLRLAVVPWGLNIDYAWPIAGPEWREFGWAAVAMVLVIAVTTYVFFTNPPLGFPGVWWFVILAPTSSVAPIIDMAFEHRTYLSLIGVVALEVIAGYEAIGWLVRRYGGDDEAAAVWRPVVLMVFVAVLSSLTLYRNYDYRSELAMWRDVRFKVPLNPRGHYNYGVYLQTAGAPEQIDEAIHEYQETLKLDPNYADAFLNLGALANWREQYADAEGYFRNFLRFRPDDITGLNGLANALVRLHRQDEARPLAERVLEQSPDNADARRIMDAIQAAESPKREPAAEPDASSVELPRL